MPKYKPGVTVQSLHALMAVYLRREPIYFRDKFLPFGFYQNWQLVLLERYVRGGMIRKVQKIKQEEG